MSTIREKRALKTTLVSWSMFLALMLGGLLLYVYPEYTKISEKKSNLNDMYKEYNDIKSSWLSFGNLKVLYSQLKSKNFQNYLTGTERNFLNDEITNSYNKNIISSIDSSFYKTNFEAPKGWNKDYFVFLENLSEEVWAEKDKLNKDNTKEKIDKILPTYVDNLKVDNDINSFISSETSTWDKLKELAYDDTKLLNYLERLVYSFGLENSWNLALWDLTPLFKSNKDTQASQEELKKIKSGIYYFDINLNLNWTKKWILNFIHFVENVWTLEVSKQWLNVYSDNELDRVRIINIWDNSSNNIYENPIIDIQEVSFKDYLDWSIKSINYQRYSDVVDFVKSTQWNDKMWVNLTLRFYVKWAASDKKLEYINKVFDLYNKETIKLNQVLNNINSSKFIKQNRKSIEYIRELSNYKNYLESIRKDLFKSKNTAGSTVNIDGAFYQFREYDKQLEIISKRVLSLESEYTKIISNNK